MQHHEATPVQCLLHARHNVFHRAIVEIQHWRLPLKSIKTCRFSVILIHNKALFIQGIFRVTHKHSTDFAKHHTWKNFTDLHCLVINKKWDK
jgi:hypothetical protein